MRHLFKFIGGCLGWLIGEWAGSRLGFGIGGPVGGVVGFVAGTVIDSFEIPFFRKKTEKANMGEFATSLLMLIGAVMNADRPIVKSELDYVKQFLKQNFGEKEAVKALALLKDILKQNIRLDDACSTIRYHLDYSSRLQFTHFLYNLANIDGHHGEAEQKLLNIIDNNLGVNTNNKRSVETKTLNDNSLLMAYATLGIPRNTNVIDVKKAYRTLANLYHPDKVVFENEEKKKFASEKFQQITKAYEVIKKERNFT